MNGEDGEDEERGDDEEGGNESGDEGGVGGGAPFKGDTFWFALEDFPQHNGGKEH